jgi:hypothetical protein
MEAWLWVFNLWYNFSMFATQKGIRIGLRGVLLNEPGININSFPPFEKRGRSVFLRKVLFKPLIENHQKYKRGMDRCQVLFLKM